MNWFSRRESESEKLAKIFASILESQFRAHAEQIAAVVAGTSESAKALSKQAESFTAYLDSFKIVGEPESRVIRDSDEYEMEVNRLRASGFPIDRTPATQLQWLEESLNIDDLVDEL